MGHNMSHNLLLFKSVLYAENEDDMDLYIKEDEILKKYDNLQKHIKMFGRHLLDLCYRNTLPIR